MEDKDQAVPMVRGDADSKLSWLICACAFLCIFVSQGINNSFGIYQVYYTTVAFPDEKPSLISWIGTTTTALMLFTGILSNKLASVIGIRNVAWMGGLFSFAGLFSASFVKSVPALIVTQGLLLGIGSGFMYSCSISVTAMWFDKYLGAAIGIVTSGSGVGGIAISRIVFAIINKLGHQWALRITSFISIFILIIFTIPFKPRVSSSKAEKVVDLSALKSPLFICLCLCGFLGNLGFVVPVYFLPSASLQIGATDNFASNLVTLFNVGYFVGGILTGRAADYVGPTNMFGISTFFIGFFTLVFWVLWKTLATLAVTAFFYGFFISGFVGLCIASIAKYYAADKILSYNGVYLFINGASLIAGNFLVSYFLDNLGKGTNFRYVATFSSIVQIVGSFFIIPAIFYIRSHFKTNSWAN
ncbi:putative transporter MCH4 [Smittium culicis]|uniref:Putative transporter MCH4 n=1 Tax=Smittium culicis TaxID=133412 RepID=A0A1R1Y3I1_9FUNG|nr:putative transporter MCH4 [Smittium culicis]OMJ22327.1 putative transporter MCH4 [Smittium culicis]